MMTYENLLNVMELTNSCLIKNAYEVTNNIIKQNEEDEFVNVFTLANKILSVESFVGDMDDFHNIAVTYARISAENYACKILEIGLRKFPRSVDLLADFIKYGVSGDTIENCEKYYKLLNMIPKKMWTWRAFSFVIDYRLACLNYNELNENEIEKEKIEILTLTKIFKKVLPEDEQSYLSSATVYREFKESKAEQKELLCALEKVKAAPRCALRLADIYYENGNFEGSLEMIKRCTWDSVIIQQGINYSYPYFLSAMCRISLLYRNYPDLGQDKSAEIEAKIKEVYMDYRSAKVNLRGKNLFDNLESQIKIFEIRTGSDREDYDI